MRKYLLIPCVAIALFVLLSEQVHAALYFVGRSNIIATDGTAPGAITPNSATATGDFMIFYHYSRATGGNETVTLPTGFTSVFNSVTANQGLVAVGWRVRQSGDTTHTASVTNHTTGTSGETILEWIETYRGVDTTQPISSWTDALSTWSSSLNIGPITAPTTTTMRNGDMGVAFGGRFENVTGQTALTGSDTLVWSAGTHADTGSGADAGAVTQQGYNVSGSTQSVSAKTITTTGTTQAGAGRMFVVRAADTGADPWVASATSTVFTSDTTSHNVRMPETVEAGDLLLMLFTIDGNATVSDPDGAGGWTEIATLTRSTFAQGSVWAKVAVGDEDNTQVDFSTGATAEQAAALVYRIHASSWYGSLDGVEAASADPGGTTATPDPPSLNPTGWDTEDTLWITYAAGSSWIAMVNPPSGYEHALHVPSAQGTAAASVSSARRQATAASEDPGAFAMSTAVSGVVFTIGVRPVSTATAPTVTTNFASNVGAASATLHGSITATGGDDADEHGFAYSTNSTLSSGVSTTTLGAFTGTGNFSGGITGLSNDTTYYFRAYATNGTGTGFGTIKSFTTGNTTATRSIRLFGGATLKFYNGKVQLFQR